MIKRILFTCVVGSYAAAGFSQPAAPEDISLEVRHGSTGAMELSQTEFRLTSGAYYRLNFDCIETTSGFDGFSFEATPFLSNIHLRVVSVGGQEIYMQGLGFRSLHCDEPGTTRFSFYPVRAGSYEFAVSNQSKPEEVLTGRFIVE